MHTDGWGCRSFSTGSERPGRAPAGGEDLVPRVERLVRGPLRAPKGGRAGQKHALLHLGRSKPGTWMARGQAETACRDPAKQGRNQVATTRHGQPIRRHRADADMQGVRHRAQVLSSKQLEPHLALEHVRQREEEPYFAHFGEYCQQTDNNSQIPPLRRTRARCKGNLACHEEVASTFLKG